MTPQTVHTNTLPKPGKFLHFQLGHERYSLAVKEVREIIRLCPVTPVPRMPDYHRGVINLRGKIVPVMDLRLRLGLAPSANLERACIIVVQREHSNSPDQLIGLQVDAVEEVAFIPEECIEPAPDFCGTIDDRFILAMAKNKEAVITILSVEELVEHGKRTDHPSSTTDTHTNNP
ncbi:MAG: chemotaxis protein CheW [Cyanobacteriota bacterium]|nr:chemotaxis protein CheW [Cyanobacteriota bacterium]